MFSHIDAVDERWFWSAKRFVISPCTMGLIVASTSRLSTQPSALIVSIDGPDALTIGCVGLSLQAARIPAARARVAVRMRRRIWAPGRRACEVELQMLESSR